MPEASQVHIDAALTNVCAAYSNPNFIADLVAPPVAVRKQSDRYFIYDPDRDRFRASDDKRAPGAEANEVNFALSTDSYYCEDHALASVIPDEERENADPPIQPEIDRVEFLMEKMLLNKEILLADRITAGTDIPGETLSGNAQWSDYQNSDPVAEVENHKATIQAAVQVAPNTLVLAYDVYTKVRLHPKVVERNPSLKIGAADTGDLEKMFGVERVLVARALKNVAAAGQTASMQYVWGKNAFLCYIPPRPAPKRVAFAYSFVWTLAPGSVAGHVVEVWRDNARKADMLRVQRYYDQKVIAPGAIYLWKAAVA
ncbi:MAG: hypothetical protein N3D11_03765 [Candidatus Sumerlaeia bacterium]|nr:hypothetical protein [Candidatus Sumerlaeia bacterium]